VNQESYWVVLALEQIDATLSLSILEVETAVNRQAMTRLLRGGGEMGCGVKIARWWQLWSLSVPSRVSSLSRWPEARHASATAG